MKELGLLRETMDFEKLLLFARDVEVRRRWKELVSYLECVISTLEGFREISDADLRRSLPVLDQEGDYEFECRVLVLLDMLARIKLRKRTLQVVPQRTMTGSYRRPRQDTFLGIGPPRIPKPTLPAPIAIRRHKPSSSLLPHGLPVYEMDADGALKKVLKEEEKDAV